MSDDPKPSPSWLALGVSLVAPGLGHAVRGHSRRGALWLVALFAVWLVGSLAAAFWLGALLLCGMVTLAWYAGCAWDSARLERKPNASRGLVELLIAVALVWFVAPIVIALLVRSLSLEAYKVAGGSMCPTLEERDHVFIDKTAYRLSAPERGDVVVYRGATAGGLDADFLHRVVAIAGDEVDVDASARLQVNGAVPKLTRTGTFACGGDVLEEELGGSHRIAIDPVPETTPARLRVPEGHVFVLGDARSSAFDSRHHGTVAVDAIKGRVWRRWLAAERIEFSTVR